MAITQGLCACLGFLAAGHPTTAASATNGILAPHDLFTLTVQELENRLSRTERFTVLPPNVAGLFCPGAGTPLFFIGNEARQIGPSDQPDDYVFDKGSFRVLRSGTLLGATADEAVVISTRESRAAGPNPVAVRDVVVAGKYSVRRMQSPGYQPVTRAFQAGRGWGFLSSRGALFHATTNLSEVDIPTKGHPAKMIEGPSGCTVLTRSQDYVPADKQGELVVTTWDARGITTNKFAETQVQALAFQGLVRLRDGRWLSIGARIAPLQAKPTGVPPEPLLAAVLKAVQSGDGAALSNALEQATAVPQEHLRGLVQLLQALPEPFGNARNLEISARESLKAARNWKPAEGISRGHQAEATALIAGYAKNLEQFLAQMEQFRNATLGISPRTIAAYIQNGYQNFSGYWIGPPRLLHQQDIQSALLDCAFLSPSNSVRRGIFRLADDGRLDLLGDYGFAFESARRDGLTFDDDPTLTLGILTDPGRERRSPWDKTCEYVGTQGGEILLFFPFEGLARLAGGSFEWVDRSEPFKQMERFAGMDAQGRIYLASSSTMMSRGQNAGFYSPQGVFTTLAYPGVARGKGGDLWVYRRTAPIPASPIRALIPVVSLPVMDAQKRVWFLPYTPARGSTGVQGPGSLGGTPSAEQALKTLLSVLPGSVGARTPYSPFGADPDGSGPATDLCRYEAGRISHAATNVPMQFVLNAGDADSLIGCTAMAKKSRAFLRDDTGLTWGDSLHDLAQKEPARVLRAAPRQARHSSAFVPIYDMSLPSDHPVIVRVGDAVWIHHAGRTEVYRDGKPQGVQERLTLLNCPAKRTLQGPIKTPVGDAMLVFGLGRATSRGWSSSLVFWAVATNNTIDLIRGPEKDMDDSCEMPLVNTAKGRLYLPRFISPFSYWMVTAPGEVEERPGRGVPTWVNRNGDLFSAINENGYSGYRLDSDELQRDLPVTYARRIRVLHEAPDGRLLCQTPEGLLWLRRTGNGDWVAAGEIPLHTGGFVFSFVGESDRELFLTVVDVRQNAYLAVLNKP